MFPNLNEILEKMTIIEIITKIIETENIDFEECSLSVFNSIFIIPLCAEGT